MSDFISAQDELPPEGEVVEVITIRRMYRHSGDWKEVYPGVENYARVICRWYDGPPFTHWRRLEGLPADAVKIE